MDPGSQVSVTSSYQGRSQPKPRLSIKLFWVLIDLIVELLVLIIKSFDNQTVSDSGM
jgi:hypothetical protein